MHDEQYYLQGLKIQKNKGTQIYNYVAHQGLQVGAKVINFGQTVNMKKKRGDSSHSPT